MPVKQQIKKAIPNCSVAVNQGKSTRMSSVVTSVLLIFLADCHQTSCSQQLENARNRMVWVTSSSKTWGWKV